jgi:hypothetical protein
MLLFLDLLIVGFCWLRPLGSWQRAIGWGLFGGVCAQANPAIGFAWGVLSLLLGVRLRSWSRPAIALLCAAVALAPWTIRNYLHFGRFIPVKSNMAYEMYQTECLQPDGLMQNTVFPLHPNSAGSRERAEYRKLGESAFLERKWQQVREAVWADPEDFLDRVALRFLGTTVWYVPFNRTQEARDPLQLWVRRVTYPLPALALLLLVFTSIPQPLTWPKWTVIGAYVLCLLPYILSSYYERYSIPLLSVKVLLVIWGLDRLVGLFLGHLKAPAPHNSEEKLSAV